MRVEASVLRTPGQVVASVSLAKAVEASSRSEGKFRFHNRPALPRLPRSFFARNVLGTPCELTRRFYHTRLREYVESIAFFAGEEENETRRRTRNKRRRTREKVDENKDEDKKEEEEEEEGEVRG